MYSQNLTYLIGVYAKLSISQNILKIAGFDTIALHRFETSTMLGLEWVEYYLEYIYFSR